MQIHPLTRDPRGTVIGSLPKTSPSITDVGTDASREHLRIWLEGGRWYAQGLGSTNGTVLESGAGDGDIVIEPPRDQREPGKIYPPVEIENSDRLPLGSPYNVSRYCGLARAVIERRSPPVFRLLPSTS
nr:FHA domain-containing protein [Collinsella aerofaciens]